MRNQNGRTYDFGNITRNKQMYLGSMQKELAFLTDMSDNEFTLPP